MRNANVAATWLTIASAVVGGAVWVGAVANEVENQKHTVVEHRAQIDKLRNESPPAIARLEEQIKDVQGDVTDIKKSQDEILKELRKK